MNKKITFAVGLLSLSLLGELLLWKYAVVFSILLIILAYIKHRIYPIKKELLWFMIISLGGAVVEIILVNFGHGWSYTDSNFLSIPIWIPFFWGLIGTTTIILYEGLINKQFEK